LPDASAAGPGFSLRNHSSPARAWRSKRANAASFCVSDSRSGWFGFPRMSHSSASVHPARGEERRKGEGRGQEAEADWRFSRARGARDCAHLAVPRAPPRAAGRTRTPSRPSALALSAVARRATVSDPGSLSSSNLLFSPVALTAPAGLAFSLKWRGLREDCTRDFFSIFLTGSHTIFLARVPRSQPPLRVARHNVSARRRAGHDVLGLVGRDCRPSPCVSQAPRRVSGDRDGRALHVNRPAIVERCA